MSQPPAKRVCPGAAAVDTPRLLLVAVRLVDEGTDNVIVLRDDRCGDGLVAQELDQEHNEAVDTVVDGRKLAVRHDTVITVEPVAYAESAAHGFVAADGTVGRCAAGPRQLFDARHVAVTFADREQTHYRCPDLKTDKITVYRNGYAEPFYSYRTHGIWPPQGKKTWALLAIESANVGDLLTLQAADGTNKFTYRVVRPNKIVTVSD